MAFRRRFIRLLETIHRFFTITVDSTMITCDSTEITVDAE